MTAERSQLDRQLIWDRLLPLINSYTQDFSIRLTPPVEDLKNFILPLSHDEVVHGKQSLLSKMPGDRWQQFANLRLLYTFQWTYPGKQLLFMGGEFAQTTEWNCKTALPWERKEEAMPDGVHQTVAALNHLQAAHPALSEWDCDSRGFEWLNGDDHVQSVISFVRRSSTETLLIVLNFTPVPRYDYRIPVNEAGEYEEVFNSDASELCGSGMLNHDRLHSEPVGFNGRENSLRLNLPPLAGVVLRKA